MKVVDRLEELKEGDVVLVIGYDDLNYTSGDAEGWFSQVYSISKEVLEGQPGSKGLGKPEGGAFDEDVGWFLLPYAGQEGTFLIGTGQERESEVAVLLLQSGQKSGLSQEA